MNKKIKPNNYSDKQIYKSQKQNFFFDNIIFQ